MKLNRKMAVVAILGILILSANLTIAQPKLKYSNKKFQKETSSRTVDEENALLIGISKKKKEISVLDFYTGNILHSIDITKHGLNEIEYYRTDESNTTGYYRGKNGKLISYNYKENKVNWIFDALNVVDAPEIYSKTLQVKIKPEKKGGDNFVVINRESGKVIRTYLEEESKDSKWYTLYDDGEISLHEKRKMNLKGVLIGDITIQARDAKTNAEIKTHIFRGASLYLKSIWDISNNQWILFYPVDKNPTLKMSERGSLFEIVAINLKNGEVNWKVQPQVKVDFSLTDYTPASSYYFHELHITNNNNLLFGGRDYITAIDLSSGEINWKVPFSNTIHEGMMKPKFVHVGTLLVRENDLFIGEVSNPDKPTASKIDIETGKTAWSATVPKKANYATDIEIQENAILFTYNSAYIKQKVKESIVDFESPVYLTFLDIESGKTKWETAFKGEVHDVLFVGDYPVAITAKEIHLLDPNSGKLLKKVAHKVELHEYSDLFMLPDGKHLVVWGSTFSVISTN